MSQVNVLQNILDSFPDEDFIMADGLDEAVIGYDHASMRLIYSVGLCVQILMQEGLTYEDALEHLNFNTLNAYVGEKTPIWCYDIL